MKGLLCGEAGERANGEDKEWSWRKESSRVKRMIHTIAGAIDFGRLQRVEDQNQHGATSLVKQLSIIKIHQKPHRPFLYLCV